MQSRFDQGYIPEPNSGCWLWDQSQGAGGYGMFELGGRSHGAHRISWQLHVGDIPVGQFVLHKCDVRCCVNPDHLFLGSARDNVLDMHMKSRNGNPRGAENGNARLSEFEVRVIRKHRFEGRSLRHIAEIMRLSYSTVRSVCTGRTWGWLE